MGLDNDSMTTVVTIGTRPLTVVVDVANPVGPAGIGDRPLGQELLNNG